MGVDGDASLNGAPSTVTGIVHEVEEPEQERPTLQRGPVHRDGDRRWWKSQGTGDRMLQRGPVHRDGDRKLWTAEKRGPPSGFNGAPSTVTGIGHPRRDVPC